MNENEIVVDLCGGYITQQIIDRIYGLAQLKHSVFDLNIKRIGPHYFPRLIADTGQFALAAVVTGAVDFERRLEALELALRLRTDQIKK